MKTILLTLFAAAACARAQVHTVTNPVPLPESFVLPGAHVLHSPAVVPREWIIRVPDAPVRTNVVDRIDAKLKWIIVTNWITVPQPLTTNVYWGTYSSGQEAGAVCSNLVAVVHWKGKDTEVTLESIRFTNLTRRYTYQVQRVYE